MPHTPRIVRTASLGILLTIALASTGCNKGLQSERDALYTQNQDLQTQLDDARLALERCQKDRADLVAQLAAGPAAPEPVAPAGPATGTTGFEDIGGVGVTRGADTITVNVPGDVLFASGRIDLQPAAKTTLAQIAGVIKRQYGGNIVRVEGYTDTDPIKKSKWTDNLELSAQRAMAVERFLVSQGLSGDNLYSAAFGESNARESKAKSRRVEIVVVTN